MLTFEQMPEAISRLLDKVESLELRLSSPGAGPASIERPMTADEACEFLSISLPTLIRWRNKGKIPYLKIGTNIRYDKAAVINAIESKKAG